MQSFEQADGLTKLGSLLCAGPIILSVLRTGVPSDGGIIAFLLFVGVVGFFLAVPQIAMVIAVRSCRDARYRQAAIWISAVSVFAYAVFAFTVDLASSSTASLSLLFFQVYALAAVCALFGVVVVGIRLFGRS
ncbi:hypothetical protein [Altererythrobacter sp. MTPC7]|uniref:hypothetical protein n=1 Tax=Altererythrobacter sp. MTPC7 TaxID=3056567 RepID=UPI0036F3F2BC